jgi:hypothetical protein
MRLALVVETPAKFKAEKVETGIPQRRTGAERDYLRFLCG